MCSQASDTTIVKFQGHPEYWDGSTLSIYEQEAKKGAVPLQHLIEKVEKRFREKSDSRSRLSGNLRRAVSSWDSTHSIEVLRSLVQTLGRCKCNLESPHIEPILRVLCIQNKQKRRYPSDLENDVAKIVADAIAELWDITGVSDRAQAFLANHEKLVNCTQAGVVAIIRCFFERGDVSLLDVVMRLFDPAFRDAGLSTAFTPEELAKGLADAVPRDFWADKLCELDYGESGNFGAADAFFQAMFLRTNSPLRICAWSFRTVEKSYYILDPSHVEQWQKNRSCYIDGAPPIREPRWRWENAVVCDPPFVRKLEEANELTCEERCSSVDNKGQGVIPMKRPSIDRHENGGPSKYIPS